MALNPLYIVASDLESYFVDKDTGLPLANGTLYFYRDSARNEPKQVFQISGSPPDYTYTSMGSQITLSSVGTVQNASGDNEVIYWYPYDDLGNIDLYYVIAVDSGGTVQFTREAWPNSAGNGSQSSSNNQLTNQISNSTFTNVLINQGIPNVYTVTSATNQVFAFAPDWSFQISGTGTVTVQQIPIAGSLNVPGNPPYMLDVTVGSGVTACNLVQTFSANSGLWTSTSASVVYLYGSIVGKNVGVGTSSVQMFYTDGTGTPVSILTASLTTTYAQQSSSTVNAINPSTNATTGSSGYATIYLSFATGSHVQVSCVELIPVFDAPVSQLPLILDSSNRNEVYQGDYYIPRAAAKQIDSFLVGWDFAVNPRGLNGATTITNSASYINFDQTICCASNFTVFYSNDSTTNGISFAPNVSATNDAFYMMQYLSAGQVYDMITSNMSVNVFGYQTDTVANNPITMQVHLFGSNSAIPTLSTSIGTINSTGAFTLTASGWTEISRNGLPTATATLSKVTSSSNINDGQNDYGFSGWSINPSVPISNFAIVVTFSYISPSTRFVINSISLVPGDLPCRPSVKSINSTLYDCQYYYRTSFTTGTLIATGQGFSNSSIGSQAVAGNSFQAGPVINFSSQMRAMPIITLFNPMGSDQNIFDFTNSANWTGTSVPFRGKMGFATQGTSPSGSIVGAISGISWTADARLGIV